MDLSVRPLTKADFDAVVALDATFGGPRRGYFEKRLRAAVQKPRRHLQLAAESNGRLVGFVLARKASGEYGDAEDAIVLEAFAVDPALRRQGAGTHMLAELTRLARARAIPAIATQAHWHDHAILGFLDAEGFELGPRRVFDRPVARLPVVDDDLDVPPPPVRNLREGDLAALAQIDERITRRDRSAYLAQKVDEALHESAIQVSLVVEDDGFPVGFAMARVDFGDFGRVATAASLDTIAVDPRFTAKGFGTALLWQMIENLAALHVERLETELSPGAVDLQGFLLHAGFAPSQRLSFRKRIPAGA